MIPLGKLWGELCQLPPRWQMPGRRFPEIFGISRCIETARGGEVETRVHFKTLYSAQSVRAIPINVCSVSKVTGCYNPAAADVPILVSVFSIVQSAT